jgi:tRNA(Ile)-lysidine synthase
MSIITKTKEFFRNHFHPNDRFILGLSGGVDSMVLAEVMILSDIPFVACHVNYQLRGEESQEDQLFVEKWCREKGIPIETKVVKKEKKHQNTQQWARDQRRLFFNECLEKYQAQYILTAHHVNDQLETQLLQFLRGSIIGLAGMKKKQGKYVRPFLDLEKNEIIAFAENIQIQWRDDSSNAKINYKRNFLRHAITPLLRENFDLNTHHIQQHSDRLHAQNSWHRELVIDWLNKHVKTSLPHHFTLEFQSIPSHLEASHILFHWLQPCGFSAEEIDGISALQFSENGAYRENESYKVYKSDKGWNLISNNTNLDFQLEIEEGQSTFTWNNQEFSIERKKIDAQFSLNKNPAILQFDASAWIHPIKIRNWMNGDRFQPLGMKGTLLLSDFFNQNKIPAALRNQIGVLTSQDQIIGILLHRISDKVKVTSITKEIIQIQKTHLDSPDEPPFE